MPRIERPKYERIDLYLPRELMEAARQKAGADGLTLFFAKLASKATGVKFEPRRRGRPPKTATKQG